MHDWFNSFGTVEGGGAVGYLCISPGAKVFFYYRGIPIYFMLYIPRVLNMMSISDLLLYCISFSPFTHFYGCPCRHLGTQDAQ